jgi:thiosulfate reductase cytochrome b subunit
MVIFSRARTVRLIWIAPAAIVVLAIVVLVAMLIRDSAAGQDFLRSYSGQVEPAVGTAIGLPAWLGWQHFLNSLFLLLIIRTGWQLRSGQKAPAYWTRTNTGRFRTKNPPRRISLTLWLHLSVDALWVLNGLVFYVLLFSTGQWLRIVPTDWAVVPNAISAALQYASLGWPTENGWVNYNALQLLAYFVTVFIAAPLAMLTGIRMSPLWPRDAIWLSRIYPVAWARAIHFPVMLYFVLFIIVHVTLVLATGVLRNLNHMYAARDDGSWVGFAIFAGSVVVMVAVWLAARPLILRPIAGLGGKVTR